MKLIKFVKENKIVIFSLFVIALTFVFLALPGQFSEYGLIQGKEFEYKLSGYQFIFGYENHDLPNKPVAQGIAIFVMLVLTFGALIFSKKSSFVSLLCGLSLLVISILFFTISVAGQKVYAQWDLTNDFKYGWVAYLSGALILIAAGLVIYRTVIMMKNEIKHPAPVSKGPSYNYLHK